MKKLLDVAFISIYRYVLAVNNYQFRSYVDSIHLSKLEVKDALQNVLYLLRIN
jgi:hypothetical protein